MQFAAPGALGLTTKICCFAAPGAFAPVSCHVIHGPGAVGSAAEPPAIAGLTASCSVWMFSDGTGAARSPARFWPANSHVFGFAALVGAWKRLAKIWFGAGEAGRALLVPGRPRHRAAGAGEVDRRHLAARAPGRSSASRGTGAARLEWPPTVPAPCVDQAPPLNARTKTWSGFAAAFSRCRKIAHGTRGLPATSEPATTSAFVGIGIDEVHRVARADPGRGVVVDLRARRQLLECAERRPGAGEDGNTGDERRPST